MNTSLERTPATRSAGTIPPCEAGIEWLKVDCGNLSASAEAARFRGASGVMEFHITVRPVGIGGAADQLACMANAYQRALRALGIDATSAVFRRVFCSDVTNQSELLDCPAFGPTEDDPCAMSRVGQAPLPFAKFALWAYHICDPSGPADKTRDGMTVSCRRGGLTHHWTTGLVDCEGKGSHEQTRRILDDYDAWLRSRDMRIADHVVRTWWFVQNIDADYQGLVEARRDFFATHGLTADTHYLASTGIAGAHHEVAARVAFDSYAIGGLHADQMDYLCAPDHLCPTHDYGVTFERATAVSYADRRHVFISGTASIDSAGHILHAGDVIGQLDRTLENIGALLAEAKAGLGDLAVILVYLRDPADGLVIEKALRERLGMVPFLLVEAPVCRPGWLIEIEGIALAPANNPHLPGF